VTASEHGTPGTGTPVGDRGIDRVLAADYLHGLVDAGLDDLRRRRTEAEQEEVNVSYLRRLVQGRIDIVQAELNRRAATSAGTLVDALPSILAPERRGAPHGLGRHSTLEPSGADERRRAETLVADVDLSDVSRCGSEQLQQALGILVEEERGLSSQRRRVQAVMDACSAELTRRYRDGEADVSMLLDGRSSSKE